MSISQLARSIVDSPTLSLNEEARLLRERGLPVIHLGIGEPKNKAPINAILAAANKLNSGDIKYTPTDGLPSLKKSIIMYTEDNYNRIIAPENILVTNGAKQSLFNVVYSIVDPQDEVIILRRTGSVIRKWLRWCMGFRSLLLPKMGPSTPEWRTSWRR